MTGEGPLATKDAIRSLCYALLIFYACDTLAQQSPVAIAGLPGDNLGAEAVPAARSAAVAPRPPKVTCEGKRLTIVAENSTLVSILAGVRACIGVDITMPEDAGEELSYVELGPGPTRDVLESLLSSTQFDYAIQASSSDAGKISSVLLMSRVKSIGDTQDNKPTQAADFSMTPARRAWLASVRAARAGAQQNDDQSRTLGTEPIRTEPIAPVIPDNPSTTQTNKDAADGTTDSSRPSGDTANSAKVDATAVPPTAAPSEPDSAIPASNHSSDLQKKIDDMQQLFEQRKKMTANPPPN